MEDIREAEKELKTGKYVTLEEYLKEFHARQKLSHPPKSKKKNI